MSTINNPLIKSSVFKSGSNQENDSFLSIENGDFDINQLLNKNAVQSPNLSNNNSYLEKLNKNLETQNSINGDYFSAKNLGSTLGSIGAIGGALASVYGMHEQKKFNKDMLEMEKDRVARENKRVDDAQANYDKVWKA
jgi:TctA family transporter